MIADPLFDDNKFLIHFQTYLLAEKRVSQNTFSAYKKDIEQLLDFFKKNKVTIKSCNKNYLKKFLKFLKEGGVTAKTLSRKISSIKAFFNYLNEKFKVPNKAIGLIFPKLEKTLPNYLSEDEIQKLFKAANKDNSNKGIRNRVMLCLLYASGMRVSELVGLALDQINFNTGFISLTGKGNKERSVPLPKNVLELLCSYIDIVRPKLFPVLKDKEFPSEKKVPNYLFFSHYKNEIRPITRQSFWIILKKILTFAHIFKDISPHTLRHSLATHLLKNGANIRSLQLLLGHEQLSTVQVYTHLEKSDIRKVYDDKHPRA